MKLKPMLSLLILSTSLPWMAQADGGLSSAYSFGGACSSQGVWTQSALSAAQNLRQITFQLKDDPNCKSLGNAVQSAIQNLESTMQSVSDSPKRAQRLSQIPNEIAALRSFIGSSPEMKGQVLSVMMNKSIEGATLGAQVQVESGESSLSMVSRGQDPQGMATGLQDFSNRIHQGAKTGLNITNQIIDSIPQLEQCLTDEDSQAFGNYIASAVQVVSSMASSGESTTGSPLATTISKITGMLREQKYAKVLSKLNNQEFLASMSCLMEVTTEAYCQNRDGMMLFKSGMEEMKLRSEANGKSSTKSENPFAGYYILNTHVPNVTRWMQKIQIGVDPKLPTDAIFQNKIQDEVVDFYKQWKVLLADYNTAAITLNSLPTLLAKQNAILKLVSQITESMNPQSFGGASGKVNFFTMSRTPVNIPFDLIGIPTPDAVLGKTFPKLSYDEWLQANMTSLPVFQDPNALVLTIERNMKAIIADANISAISYYNKWYIVDKQALVSESLIDINYTVKDSLEAVNSYLDQLKERTVKFNGDPKLIPVILDTQMRIRRIFAAYDRLDVVQKNVQQVLNAQGKDSDIRQINVSEIEDAYTDLVNIVFEQFNVMQSRSGFLANRMVNFVYQDYILLVKNKVNFTDYQEELFISQGMAAFDKMLQLYNGNPANIQNDLNLGLRLNLGNIEAMEELIKNSVINMIVQVKAAEEQKQESGFQRFDRLLGDLVDDKKATYTGDGIFSVLPKALMYWFDNSDRYSKVKGNTGVQSEFEDARYVRSQLCVQALAFNNQAGIQKLCQDSVLTSPIVGADPKKYSVSYSQELTRYLKEGAAETGASASLSPQMRQSLNRSQRICAFRDFNRKNMVLFMLMGQKK